LQKLVTRGPRVLPTSARMSESPLIDPNSPATLLPLPSPRHLTFRGSPQGAWPSIHSVDPPASPASGGAVLTLTATDLRLGARILVGGTECALVPESLGPTGARCVLPAIAIGNASIARLDVTVVQADNTTATLPGAFIAQVRGAAAVCCLDPSPQDRMGCNPTHQARAMAKPYSGREQPRMPAL